MFDILRLVCSALNIIKSSKPENIYTMKAAILEQVGQPVTVKEIQNPEPEKGEVRVRIKAAALNHRDVWIQKGRYPGNKENIIAGSDGCGVIDEVGESVDRKHIGKEVIINPSLNWGKDGRAQSSEFKILGNPDPGTLAERIVVPFENIHPKPQHLAATEAAALPLAGLTAYRALFTRAAINAGENVLINGVGGGVALLGMQMAISWGAKVYVSSSSENKQKRAIEMGAEKAYDYQKENWGKEAAEETGGFDVILDGAAGPGFSELVDAVKPGGRIAIYGRTAGPFPELQPAKIFYKQASILGTTMGSPDEFVAMTNVVSDKKIKPVVDKEFPLEKTEEAFRHMDEGKQFGKIVIRMD